MKQHFIAIRAEDGTVQLLERTSEEVIAEALNFLVEEGIDEGAHFRGPWDEIEEDELRSVIDDPAAFSRVIELARVGIIQKLKKVMEDRRNP